MYELLNSVCFLFYGGANSPRQNTESDLATSLANCLPAYLKPRPILLEIQRLAQDLRIRPGHKQKRRPAHSVRRAALRYVYHRLTETAVLSGSGCNTLWKIEGRKVYFSHVFKNLFTPEVDFLSNWFLFSSPTQIGYHGPNGLSMRVQCTIHTHNNFLNRQTMKICDWIYFFGGFYDIPKIIFHARRTCSWEPKWISYIFYSFILIRHILYYSIKNIQNLNNLN